MAQTGLRSEDLLVMRGTPAEKDYRDMLFNYLLRQADQATEKRLRRLEALQSRDDVKGWQDSNRENFLRLIGGLPGPRSSLNPRYIGELPRQGYVVRKVIFESLPEFFVTANLYVPTAGKAPFPAVLAPIGHSANGKSYGVYQHLFVGLVKRGYVVLTYDPVGQGERSQYWDFVAHRLRFNLNEHGLAGIPEYLLGENFARYRICDGIRALDFLAGLPEVDPDRIGVTGSSGGGTLTTYIAMLDSRVKAVSIVCYITSLSKKIENRINDAETDPEQDIPGLLAAGLDHTEMAGMIAPRPVLIGAELLDFFPIAGTRKTFADLERIYKTLGASDHLQMVVDNGPHSYSKPLREATYAWFDRWLKGVEGAAPEPPIVVEPDRELQCTPTGQVMNSLGGTRVIDFNRAEAARLGSSLDDRRHSAGFSNGLESRIRHRLALPAASAEPREIGMGQGATGDLIVEKLLLQTEPGIVVPMRILRSRGISGRAPAVVYLRNESGDDDRPTVFEAMARAARIVVLIDVRGFGETMAPRKAPYTEFRYFDPRSGMDADFTFASFFLGRPLLGMRVEDGRQAIAYLRSRPEIVPEGISVSGRGGAGLVALYLAALDPRLSSVAIAGSPASYIEIARSEFTEQPVSLMLPGVLEDFDLQDVFAALAPRSLLVINPTDALARKMTAEEAAEAFAEVRRAYSTAPEPHAFKLEILALDSEVESEVASWLAK